MNTVVKKFSNMEARNIKKVISIDTAVLRTLDNTSCEYKRSKSYTGAIACAINCGIKDDFKNILNPLDSGNFIFELPQKIYKLLSMKVIHVDLPKRMYNISEKLRNNHFTLVENGVSKEISINTGSYTISHLICAINKVLKQQGVNDGTSDEEQTFFDYDCKTNRVGLHVDGDNRVIFTQTKCSFTNFETTLGWILGFRAERVPYACSAYPQVFVGDAAPELDIPYVYMCVNDFNRNNNEVYSTTVNRQSNILAKIPLKTTMASCKECCVEDTEICDCTDGALIEVPETTINETFFDIMNREREYFSPINLEKMQIQFLDRFERIMDFGEDTINCCIEFECMYS